ncbi:MAG TPA: MBOAT family O-acyltransferase [Candidatus Margulisiibacteriota bacterium]|nr:MBOAT family O-acyltransferase [Candidatus Margulisiibacteriota bacterium]
MLFNSWEFVALALVTLVLYYTVPRRPYQLLVLLGASLIFYGYQNPPLVLLLIGSILINAISSYLVVHGRPARRLFWAATGVIANLGLLVFFKYSALLYRTVAGVRGAGDPVGAFLTGIPLPIGISFFTFQGISLVVDAYRNRRAATTIVEVHPQFRRHLLDIAVFKAFFPQLVSGPIVKAHEFLPQIAAKRLRDVDWEFACRHLILGYFFKMVVADHLKDQTFWIAYPYFRSFSSLTLLVMLFGYSMQIFADFAGYSLIAIGIGALFGYRLPVNFEFPYIAQSFSEFWRRWHISLSTWLREYLYIPIGGNRRSPSRTYANLMAVMLLGGLWHGAAWSYAVWGGWHGVALAVERFLGNRIRWATDALPLRVLKAAAVFTFVTMAWLLFKLPNFGDVIEFLRSLRDQTQLPMQKKIVFTIFVYSLPVIGYHLAYVLRDRPRWRALRRADAAVFGLLLFLICVSSGAPGAFIYFQF